LLFTCTNSRLTYICMVCLYHQLCTLYMYINSLFVRSIVKRLHVLLAVYLESNILYSPFDSLFRARCTTLCDKVCQWLATGRWFSQSPPVSSTNKTDSHDIAEIFLKAALSTIKQTKKNEKLRKKNLLGHTCTYIYTILKYM
jgi:hypothetical protein